eukprot:92211-Amphidinium_carterae.1
MRRSHPGHVDNNMDILSCVLSGPLRTSSSTLLEHWGGLQSWKKDQVCEQIPTAISRRLTIVSGDITKN